MGARRGSPRPHARLWGRDLVLIEALRGFSVDTTRRPPVPEPLPDDDARRSPAASVIRQPRTARARRAQESGYPTSTTGYKGTDLRLSPPCAKKAFRGDWHPARARHITKGTVLVRAHRAGLPRHDLGTASHDLFETGMESILGRVLPAKLVHGHIESLLNRASRRSSTCVDFEQKLTSRGASTAPLWRPPPRGHPLRNGMNLLGVSPVHRKSLCQLR